MKDPAQRTLRRAIPALFAVFALALAQTAFAADWTDANDPAVTYTALRSLKGTNSGYVATDITPLCTDIVKMKFQPVAAAGALFCARDASASGMFTCYHSTADGSIRIDRGAKSTSNQKTSTSKVSTGNDYLLTADYGNKTATIVLSGGGADLFGKALGGADTYTVGSSLALFAMHSNHSSYSSYGTDYIYYFELYDSSGDLTHCLLPAQRDSDSAYGFYDTRTGTFYPQSGGALIAAARTVNVTDTCKKWTGRGDGVSMSQGANWEGGTAPGDGDNLDFTLAPPLAEINADITGVTFGKLWIDDGDIPAFTGSMSVSDCNNRAKVAGNTSVVFPAGNYTWRGTETNWGDADAWTFDNAAATWADGNNAIFNTANAAATLDANASANSLAFSANATIGGAATLTVPSVSVASGVSATISAPTAGAIEKTGAGTLTLSQNRSAATTVTAGTLKMDGATVSGLTLGTDGGPSVVFDYGGQTLSAVPSTYLVTGSEVTLTNGVFSSSSTISIRDSATIPTVLTIAKDASLVPDNGGLYILKDNGTATINVAGGTLGNATAGSTVSYLQHGSDNGRMEINVTDGGHWAYPAALYALCNGTTGTNPSLYMMLKDSTFSVNGTFFFGNTQTRPTSATGVFAATNSVVSIASAFYIGRNANDNKAGSLTADFEDCIVTAKYFAVYHDRPLNSARFNNTTFVFGADDGSFATSDGADNWITVGDNGLTLDTQTNACRLNANLGGTGAVTKIGSGTLTVSKNQASTGGFNVNEGTLSVSGGVTFAGPVAFETGAAFDIASATPGVASITATSLTFPATGTVPLTFAGGAFAEGIYMVCSATGVTAADGEKFSLATEGGIGYIWSVSDSALLLTVGHVDPNAWTGLAGDGRMSTPGNWAGNAVPAAGADIDLSGISADTTLIADAGRTFGAVTMGAGVVTFTNSFATASFSDTSKVAVGADSTVTLVGDLVFATNVTACVCYSIAAGGMFAVTGDIIASAEHTGYVIPCIGQDSIPGTISCKGIVNNCGSSGDRFYLVRGKSNTLANWLVGEDGISGAKRFLIGNYNNSHANISAKTNFTVSADIVQSRNLTLDTAGHVVTFGTNTLVKSGGILGGSANGLTTVTGAGRVVVNYDVNDLSSAASSRTNAFTVATGATLALNPGANIGFGAVAVQDGGALEIPSGTNTFGNLTLADGAILGFCFTARRKPPVLALYDGATTAVQGAVTVRMSSVCDWPRSGETLLTTCGGFDGVNLELSTVGDAVRWAKPDRLSVNGDYNIVLDVKPMGTMILFR